jgi:hypothetical protein
MKSKKLLNEIAYSKVLMGIQENLINEGIDSEDISSMSKLNSSPLKTDKYFIIHHTAGRGDAANVVKVLNSRTIKGKKVTLGIQWVIDREGKIFQTLPKGHRGSHMLNSDNWPPSPKGINNSNTQGVEIIANDDKDILPIQCLSALKLIKHLGYSQGNIYGHGEVNMGHKAATEGKTCKAFVLKHWSDDIDELESEMKKKDFIADVDVKKSEADKIEKLLDKVGLKKVADMDLDKDGKKFSKEMTDLFGDKKEKDVKKDSDIKDDDKKDSDDEGLFKDIFGLSLKDLVKKANSIFEEKLNEEIKKMKKPIR